MRSFFNKLWLDWNRFWFFDIDRVSHRLTAFRVSFGAVMAYYFLTRQEVLDVFYTDQGILPRADLLRIKIMHWSPTILSLTNDIHVLSGLNLLLVGFCITLSLGIFPRMSALLCYLLATAFSNRDVWSDIGIDYISMFYFLYLVFIPSRKQHQPGSGSRLLGSVFYRLMQIQLCIIYMYSGWAKLRGATWWSGDALANALSAHPFQYWDLHFLTVFPPLLVGMSFAVLFYEIYFPFLMLFRDNRRGILGFGIIFHLGVVVFLSLHTFGLMMLAIYLLFWPEEDLKRGMEWLRKKLSRHRRLGNHRTLQCR